MISRPTVLVLGAGASYPYGFPTAEQLKWKIYEAFENERTPASQFLAAEGDYSASEFSDFAMALRYSGQQSVDAFIEQRGKQNKNFIPVGKLAIAYCLIPSEENPNLFHNWSDPRRGGNWYQHLFGKLNTSFEDFACNQVSIITFNYDRSLEQYLLTSLQNSHGKDFDECAALVSNIPIIHVYGQLGRLPYPQDRTVPYVPNNKNLAHVKAAAAGIKLYHEATPALKKAHEVLGAAEIVCFLGFGYLPVNVQRLAIKTETINTKTIFGSALGLRGQELLDAAVRVQKALGSKAKLLVDDNLGVLQEYGVLG